MQATTDHFLEIQEDAQSNPFEKFLAILLGTHAKNYAENILKSQSLVEQIRTVKYPCLIGDKLVDLVKSGI
ncbi:hypothetical protein C7B70_23780 [Chlorogloea sp. CCALA 695]|nr:hypothetical protein C7B70_23780 [Chlorogloea sp. CCALA 695]